MCLLQRLLTCTVASKRVKLVSKTYTKLDLYKVRYGAMIWKYGSRI